jgi:hypothetical protein
MAIYGLADNGLKIVKKFIGDCPPDFNEALSKPLLEVLEDGPDQYRNMILEGIKKYAGNTDMTYGMMEIFRTACDAVGLPESV